METKKDIGAAIKHRLDTFKDSPDYTVWSNIEAQLKKKKKRRLLIFWLSRVGTAVVLLLIWQLNTPNNITEKLHINSKSNNQTQKNRDLKKTNTDFNQTHLSTKGITNNDSLANNQIVSVPINKTKEHSSNSVKYYTKKNKSTISNSNDVTPSTIADATETKDVMNDSLFVDLVKNKKDTNLKKENEKDSLKQKNEHKWSIHPYSSITYYDFFNTKANNQISTNYGIYLNYLASKRFSLRSGIQKVNLQYSIKEQNINREQKVSYLEFPLEIRYSPFRKKINPYFTTGVSYSILKDATISLQENQTITNKHIFNKTMLSLNFGTGLQTKLYKDIYFNLESTFKYQIKPHREDINLSPFTISLIAGIEYKF